MAKGIVIRNEQEKIAVEVLTKAHAWMCKEYDVTNSLIFQRECNWGKDAFHAGWYRNSTNTIALNFRNMYGATIKDLISVLGHEIRHAVQYKTGMLKRNGNQNRVSSRSSYISGIWNNEDFFGKYIDTPWEIDARAFQDQYADACIKALKIEAVSKTQLPFGTKTESDRRATYDKILKKHAEGTFELLHASWFKAKKYKPSDGMFYIQKRNMLKNFDFKNPKHVNWLRNYGQGWIRFVPMVKVTSQYGGFSVEEMVS
tara:strand:- start:6024 stop:6794 length:771 start_codon:yes stop_codon:yes gene_type:complete